MPASCSADGADGAAALLFVVNAAKDMRALVADTISLDAGVAVHEDWLDLLFNYIKTVSP